MVGLLGQLFDRRRVADRHTMSPARSDREFDRNRNVFGPRRCRYTPAGLPLTSMPGSLVHCRRNSGTGWVTAGRAVHDMARWAQDAHGPSALVPAMHDAIRRLIIGSLNSAPGCGAVQGGQSDEQCRKSAEHPWFFFGGSNGHWQIAIGHGLKSCSRIGPDPGKSQRRRQLRHGFVIRKRHFLHRAPLHKAASGTKARDRRRNAHG